MGNLWNVGYRVNLGNLGNVGNVEIVGNLGNLRNSGNLFILIFNCFKNLRKFFLQFYIKYLFYDCKVFSSVFFYKCIVKFYIFE